MTVFIDIHTHQPAEESGVFKVCNLMIGRGELPSLHAYANGTGAYSAGVHPWDAALWTEAMQGQLEASLGQVLMVGEIGLDKRKGPSLKDQEPVFRWQAELAARVGKPVILHVVSAAQEVLAIKKAVKGVPAWIVHGFNKGPEALSQWLSQGFLVSFGHRFNTEALRRCPPDRFFLETDEEDDIQSLYRRVAEVLACSMEALKERQAANFSRLFPGTPLA